MDRHWFSSCFAEVEKWGLQNASNVLLWMHPLLRQDQITFFSPFALWYLKIEIESKSWSDLLSYSKRMISKPPFDHDWKTNRASKQNILIHVVWCRPEKLALGVILRTEKLLLWFVLYVYILVIYLKPTLGLLMNFHLLSFFFNSAVPKLWKECNLFSLSIFSRDN